jgi:8-oxo-dGTP pyrophosphatase MutT (NUDIX family)
MTKTPHQLTENAKLLHKIALNHNGEILILKRDSNSNSRPDKWDLAGGNSEWPSDDKHGHGIHKEDVVREIIEETGIEIPTDTFNFSTLTFFDTFFDSQKQIFTIMCGWKYTFPDDFDRSQVKISNEHSKAKWIKLKELDHIDFGGNKGEFVKDITKKGFL